MGIRLSSLTLLLSATAFAAKWDAAVQVNQSSVPFQFELAGTPDAPQGWFFNGDERIVSTAGSWDGNDLTLRFAQYGSVLKAKLVDGKLEGAYDRGTRGTYLFHATPAVAPDISGTWDFPVKSAKGEQAWRFVAKQQQGTVTGAILRIDGDTGTLTGTYRDGTFHLSHFSGARPILVDATPHPDGSLDLVINGKDHYRALRQQQAREAAMPEPTKSFQHTSFINSADPFPFAFPDLAGRLISNTDKQFQGKVVLLAISGSWCPNCHDEAPYLESLYRKYRSEGLEIIALSFEEADQLKNPERLRAFIKQYGLEYTVVLAGEPDQMQSKLPQATNLNSFPTTIFLGRDGKVRAVHAGFSGRATGHFYDEQALEMEGLLEKLLHENGATNAVSSSREE